MATEVAKGIHNHPKFKLGSIVGSGKKDNRTVQLSDFVKVDAAGAPASWDFDKGRKPFPAHMWGNDQYGDCEVAGRANYLLRLQRSQTRTTPGISDEDVIALYKQMTGCVSPGDNNDSGLTTLDNLGQWRNGWSITKDWQIGGNQTRDYKLSAYGLVDHKNAQLLRTCMYLFSGVLYGINLPITAQAQTEQGQPWDVVSGAGSNSDPGSWGGHCVYSKKYDDKTTPVLTWQREVVMTDAFKDAYVEEAYCVVDAFDTWFNFKHVLDVNALISQMQSAGINVQQ